jgi:hypothetical protein
VEKMQRDLLEKDEELTRRRKKITHLTNNIERLERELQKKGGEEAAIELTNKQNAHLLVLLQQHEAKTEQLEEVRSELEEALSSLRERHEELMKTSVSFFFFTIYSLGFLFLAHLVIILFSGSF